LEALPVKDHGRSDDREEIVETDTDEGSPVDIRTDDNKLIFSLNSEPGYTLDELLAGVTSDNIHPEVDMGIPIGRELL
jgi:antitoxin MazE